MEEQIIVLSSSSSSDSCNTGDLRAFANRIPNRLRVPNHDLVRGICSVNTPYFSEPQAIWVYSPQTSESGESVIQHVSGSFSILNPEHPIFIDVTRKSSEDPDDSAEENLLNGRVLVRSNPIRHDPGSHV
jgi:hypothetical protein